jgi:hypothetical protein
MKDSFRQSQNENCLKPAQRKLQNIVAGWRKTAAKGLLFGYAANLLSGCGVSLEIRTGDARISPAPITNYDNPYTNVFFPLDTDDDGPIFYTAQRKRIGVEWVFIRGNYIYLHPHKNRFFVINNGHGYFLSAKAEREAREAHKRQQIEKQKQLNEQRRRHPNDPMPPGFRYDTSGDRYPHKF